MVLCERQHISTLSLKVLRKSKLNLELKNLIDFSSTAELKYFSESRRKCTGITELA